MKRFTTRTTVALALGLGLTLALLWVMEGLPTVEAAPTATSRYVALVGTDASNDCTDSGSPCRTIQHAVDNADAGDEILVAMGTYTDLHKRSNITQVVYIDTPVTIHGGYTTTNDFADPSYPITQPTTLDAGGQGRVIYVSNVTATLEGLHLTNGLGAFGGGISAASTNPRSLAISDCHIYNNTASGSGGGLYADSISPQDLVISGSHIYSNTASNRGGGIYISNGFSPTLTGNKIYSNTASNNGGGIYLNFQDYVAPALTDNDVYGNTAGREGGGIWLAGGTNATVTGNHIYSNTATGSAGTGSGGGGIYVYHSNTAMLTDNHIYLNTAASSGGGIALWNSDNVTLMSNQIYSNTSTFMGGGVYCGIVPTATLMSNQVYGNAADSGGGIFLAGGDNATVTGNHIYRNAATSDGGGIVLGDSSDTLVRGNQIYSNTATVDGGGIILMNDCHGTVVEENDIYNNTAERFGGGISTSHAPTLTLKHNQVYSNTALNSGGGLHCQTSHATRLAANDVHHNSGGGGGGIVIYSSNDVTLAGNQIYANTATTYDGGGLTADLSFGTHLVNNIVVDNRALSSSRVPGIVIIRSTAHFLHTTVARNTGGNGIGLGVASFCDISSTVILTNTILVSHSVGIEVQSFATATLNTTLWGDGVWANDIPVINNGTIFSSTNLAGAPAFVDPDGGDYHITRFSAARDAATGAGVVDDIDGDSRLFDAQPDVGADEYACHVRLDGMPYSTVQDAVDAATDGDVVMVAGTCRGIQTRGPLATQQTAYVTESITIRGGYDASFSAWDPNTYPTTLDAQGEGRVIYLTGDVTPTLEGLRLTRGSVVGAGGGIYSIDAHPVISGCQIYSNTTVTSGSGIYLNGSDGALLMYNDIYSNTAGNSTGGIYLHNCNSATSMSNIVHGNSALFSGGIYVRDSSGVVLMNTMVVENRITSVWGAGLRIRNSEAHLLHTTIARNSGGSGEGVYVSHGATVWMTNTILVSHTVGISVTSGNTVTLSATLWGSGTWANDEDWGGDGQVFTSIDVHGDPAFVDAESGDYHIGAASAAIDRGIPTPVSADIDGDDRPFGGTLPDLGADEGLPELILAKHGQAWVNQGQVYTYTLTVTNLGAVTATTAVLTDAVPSGADFSWASDGGLELDDVVQWPTFTIPPGGGVVTRTFAVRTGSTLVNSDYRVTAWGIPGVAGAVLTTPLNLNPVAQADASPSILHSGSVTLDGSGSYDPDGNDPLEYLWWQVTGPAAVTLNDADTAIASFRAPSVEGLYQFLLQVTDTLGGRQADFVNVTVTNDPPVADAGAPQSAHAGTVMLDGSGSSDPNGDPLTYGWTQADGPLVILSDPTAEQPTFTPTAIGVLTFTLTVTDTFGESHLDTTTVTITNTAPTADAGPPQSAAPGTLVTLDGSGSSDPDGDPLTYGWAQTGGTPVALSSSTAVSPTFTAPSTPGETLIFTLTVTDTFGVAHSDVTTVTIKHYVYLPLILRNAP